MTFIITWIYFAFAALFGWVAIREWRKGYTFGAVWGFSLWLFFLAQSVFIVCMGMLEAIQKLTK